MSSYDFHPLVDEWFRERFGEPTEPQRLGWPAIAAGRHTLIAAPTGSGKTLSAFLVCLDRLLRRSIEGSLEAGIHVVYVSPLRALSNDIHRNLEVPLAELMQRAAAAELPHTPLRVAVRTGDTPNSERQAMLRRPPHILVTTPESLYLLLTSPKSREKLRHVETVIVDEIHALARDKRGSHLALTLERLEALCPKPPVRIGLSATQRPIEEIARFLVGQSTVNAAHDGSDVPCTIVDVGHARELDLAIEVPPSELSAVCSHEQWAEVYERLTVLIQQHRSTLIFVNTRRLAERVSLRLGELLGEHAVASHHGSLSRALRLSAEQRLKNGELKAIVATASLEMGIDIGYIDLVCQIGSPRSIAAFLQRVGRSGHHLKATPKGRLFPLTRDELLECMAMIRSVRRGVLDAIEIPKAPLDILAQQIVASVACDEWDEEALFELCRRAYPYRELTRADYERVIEMLANGLTRGNRRGKYLHRDRIQRKLRPVRGARLAAITSGGAIPETGEYRVVTEEERSFVGTLDEDFAIESNAGDIFVLGNTSWRVRAVRNGEVVVRDAEGAPPTIPFWFGEAPGRTVELSHAVSELRREIAEQLTIAAEQRPACQEPAALALAGAVSAADSPTGPVAVAPPPSSPAAGARSLAQWLHDECGVEEWAAEQAVRYIEAQLAAVGLVPTQEEILFERFFDESGGMQLVIHAPLGMRINRAWGLALRKRFCRSFDFELQAAATDNGIVLSLSPQHSFPIEQLFSMLGPHNGRYLLEQAILAVPMFQVRWRWNITRALAVLRFQAGRKVPPHLQRFRAEDLLAAAFPETVGCLENHHGDVEIPDHPLVYQTMEDCLREAMDVDRWLNVLGDVQEQRIRLVPRETREPSPFCHELLNANPYAFLDDAPLEERRTRAVSTRRSLDVDAFRDLTRLDADAIEQVAADAWPLVRDADELHEALVNLLLIEPDEAADWQSWFEQLVREGRATQVRIANKTYWVAADRWPWIRAAYDDVIAEPVLDLPPEMEIACERSEAWVEIVRGRITHSGPRTAEQLADQLSLEPGQVRAALEALEGQGCVMRGRYSPDHDGATEQWCERRLLARIHRLTLDGLRKRIQPVSPRDFLRFLARHQKLVCENGPHELRFGGPDALRDLLAQLQGFEMPAAAWEKDVLRARSPDYDPQWLDQLFLSGEIVWGRLRPPAREGETEKRLAAMTRTVPISLVLREDLPWLLPLERADVTGWLGSNAADVLEALRTRGALFFPELKTLTGLLPTHLEEALRQLAAVGLVTSDTFAAVRAIVATKKQIAYRQGSGRTVAAPAGRWSQFPGYVETPTREQYLDAWCRQLLRRYGVVFRELLVREPTAPSWSELLPIWRRMELQGELRGGRFVRDVGGEQFATEEAVQQLRETRDRPLGDSWAVISAADPLNLLGTLFPGTRVPASHKNSLVLREGTYVAVRRNRDIEFLESVDLPLQLAMRRALQGIRSVTAETISYIPPPPVGGTPWQANPFRQN